MDGGNADSDHSMTWEDFFGSTTDLAPTLIGIYDSLLEPKNSGPEASRFDLNAKDARNDPPLEETTQEKQPKMNEDAVKDPPKTIKISMNKSSLYTIRTKDDISNETAQKSSLYKPLKSFKNDKVSDISSTQNNFDLSPNVRRMISSATDTTTGLRFQKRTTTIRSSGRHKSNIPLVGATSKISQSGVEIIPSVEIYDQPCATKTKQNDTPVEIPPKTFKADFKLGSDYDIPKNKAIYDVPTQNKTAFESLSLPYIDQSIELSITCNDREFDTKLSSKENSPDKPKIPTNLPTKISYNFDKASPEKSKIPNLVIKNANGLENDKKIQEIPIKIINMAPNGTNSLNRNDFNKDYSDKTCKLNPASEVTRPLSMSSIASSSSTSSSGVHNKGGVNSAYLASIESLDDHSDDISSTVGSNNFVNNSGIKNDDRVQNINFPPKDELSGLSQLERVCAEIVQTENVYVEDLRQVVEGYQHVWRKEVVFSEEELADLFNNIEDIYVFNRSLCDELNTCRLEAISIAKCFVDHNTGFTVYTSYCTGYPRTMERLAVLASSPHSARVFRERQVALGHPLPLASYLLKPVQRILKYHLLLQNVVKLCTCRETEFALLKMTGIAQHIDDMKRKHEHSVRVQEIQSLLYGWVGPDLTTYGELCAEGTFRVFGAKAVRHVFLFDKMLLITKNREDGILAYKSHIMCNNMMLVEAISGAPLSFHVIPWDAPRAQVTLQATSPRHKREWTLLLKRAILENYNAVIPSHARQLVMELGQNRTDDDILAEKSHNLITQASMRKQLSAPEYLEKRKLERDRRKSFENGVRGRSKKNRKQIAARPEKQCNCTQISAEKGVDVTCENCYIDLCSDCESEIMKSEKVECICKNELKCPECDKYLHYIDSGSAEQLERKQSCKCTDFKSSQESVGKEFPLNKNRGYHSSDNIVGYTEDKVLNEANNSCSNIGIKKTCLKCSKIKENIVVNEYNTTLSTRKSRRSEFDKKNDLQRSKSKDDPQRSKLSKIGTWRRKSEPGLPPNQTIPKRSLDNENDKTELQGTEKIEFECRNCGSNKITKKVKNDLILSDPELDKTRSLKTGVEIKMYNSKNIPKKISKLKKNRAKSTRHTLDTSARFYADLSTDVSTENILHISESTDSLNVIGKSDKTNLVINSKPISKDEDIDEEMYKKLIEKTDSFKKNELEKVKYLNKQNVIKEGTEDERVQEIEAEEPLEQIISQLLLQNREYQKLLKKQQLRNTAQRRHQRLLKSHSNPEPTTSKHSDQTKIKPKFGRQTSETLDQKLCLDKVITTLSPPNEERDSDDDHIYETLRIVNSTPKEINEPDLSSDKAPKPPESDYVYLSFDQLNKIKDDESIYDVPVKRNEKVPNTQTDYYVPMEIQGLRKNKPSSTNEYDSLVEVRQKQEPVVPSGYLPMNPEKSPNTPEIWLSHQKEHFNVSRDRKSGSLPRSFQVVTSNNEDNNLSTFRAKPANKTYLNRDGKVLSIDRPYTIASDQSEISFDDVENYMSDGDILKLNKNTLATNGNNVQNISKSTLELEEEIDRCYKTNFEKNVEVKSENLLTISQANLASVTSSCEALTSEKATENDSDIIHPENKIYKPTSNVLSLKNVLSRFKSKSGNKSVENEVCNGPSSPDSTSSDMKSPTSEKRPALNPRSYSKNLLQRFRNIIGDETDEKTSPVKSKIKVVVTSTDINPVQTTVVTDPLSKSVCVETTISESQNEKNNLEELSHSCDEINRQKEVSRNYERNPSIVSSTSTKSNTSSYQSLNKLPIYMQGSKQLGSRIAQSDYVDPTTLLSEKSSNVNVLINKNAVRPDSLFSNLSFVTSSSEGTYQTPRVDTKPVEEAMINSYENIYEKSFEKIEQVTDDVFRDSAVYSDQDDEFRERVKTDVRIEKNSSFRNTVITVTSSVQSETMKTKLITNKIQIEKVKDTQISKSKIAPPVPAKPKIIDKPMKLNKPLIDKPDTTIADTTKTVKRNASLKQTYLKSETTQLKPKIDVNIEKGDRTKVNEPISKPNPVQLKRLGFERASLDSATRKQKTIELESKRSSGEIPRNVSKTVLERRMEIESRNLKPVTARKPSQIAKPVSITNKMATFQKGEKSSNNIPKTSISDENDESKESWVKQVVNKFQ